MIWLTWRQFRGQALVAAAALAALAIHLVILGLRIRHSYEVDVSCTGCSAEAGKDSLTGKYDNVLLLTGLLLVLVPGVIGAFWGAPLVARELETGTHRLVWNQSVTRSRWLTVKLGFVTLAGVAFTGALSLLFTWAASPFDRLIDNRFDPVFFPTRNIAPLGYAVFAVVTGIAVGLLAKRTVPAMAVTLALFLGMQILMPTVIRPHLQAPVTESVAFSPQAVQGLGIDQAGRTRVQGEKIPGAWTLTGETPLLDTAGAPVAPAKARACFQDSPGRADACLEAMNLHFDRTYQPADRYWPFQWLEFGMYLLLALLLAGFTLWRIPRSLS